MVGTSNFFEGAEKLVEIWFGKREEMTINCDLRKIPRRDLEAMLEVVKCSIVSHVSSNDLDAYVLSESSMFISRHRFILKTCGSTTPLDCLPQLFCLVKKYAGFDQVQDFFYSRKNFKKPELQEGPHKSFEEESDILDKNFSGRGGRAYCLGSLNGEDCWYLYVVSSAVSKKQMLAQRNDSNRDKKNCKDPDQTLEILMTDVDDEKMKFFYKHNFNDAKQATKLSGIDTLLSNMTIDDHQFEPCGYSMNGVSRTVKGGYMTIHITPEPEFSYVSFETNVPVSDIKDLVNRVVSMFGPKQFVITLFSTEGVCLNDFGSTITDSDYANYVSKDLQMCRLTEYDLSYALYSRSPS